jgi:hypothetical protein
MIEILKGNLIEVKYGLLLHGCNCQGKMGSGVALAIRNRYPAAYENYMNLVTTLGDGITNKNLGGIVQHVPITFSLSVLNGFTQCFYGRDEGIRYASTNYIDRVLSQAFFIARSQGMILNTVKIGCNLGGLSFEDDVEPIFRKYEMLYPEVEVNIFDFKG